MPNPSWMVTVVTNKQAYTYGPFKNKLEAVDWSNSNLNGYKEIYVVRLCVPASCIDNI